MSQPTILSHNSPVAALLQQKRVKLTNSNGRETTTSSQSFDIAIKELADAADPVELLMENIGYTPNNIQILFQFSSRSLFNPPMPQGGGLLLTFVSLLVMNKEGMEEFLNLKTPVSRKKELISSALLGSLCEQNPHKKELENLIELLPHKYIENIELKLSTALLQSHPTPFEQAQYLQNEGFFGIHAAQYAFGVKKRLSPFSTNYSACLLSEKLVARYKILVDGALKSDPELENKFKFVKHMAGYFNTKPKPDLSQEPPRTCSYDSSSEYMYESDRQKPHPGHLEFRDVYCEQVGNLRSVQLVLNDRVNDINKWLYYLYESFRVNSWTEIELKNKVSEDLKNYHKFFNGNPLDLARQQWVYRVWPFVLFHFLGEKNANLFRDIDFGRQLNKRI